MGCSWLLTFCLSSIDISTKKQKMLCEPLITSLLLKDLIELELICTSVEEVQRNSQSIQEMLFQWLKNHTTLVLLKCFLFEVIYTLSSHPKRAYFFPETECLFVTQGKLLKPSSFNFLSCRKKRKKKKKTGPGTLNRLHHKAGDWVYIPWK